MRVGLRMDKRLSRRNGLGRMFHESVPDLQRTRQMHAVRWIRKDGDHPRNARPAAVSRYASPVKVRAGSNCHPP
jgi:hypothetical protein